MNDDLQDICSRSANGAAAPDAPAASSTISDPFLRRLVSGESAWVKAVQDKQKALANHLTEVETALRERAFGTKGKLAALLDSLPAASAATPGSFSVDGTESSASVLMPARDSACKRALLQ